MKTRVAICVCTRERPKMLEACLRSLIDQKADDRLDVFLIIIDNDVKHSALPVFVDLRSHAARNMHYVNEPQPGIPFARNRALAVAGRLDADYIAFIDDDEIADEGWIDNLMHKDYRHVAVVTGVNIPVYSDLPPVWVTPFEEKHSEGQHLKTAYTGNVRFSIKLVEAGLRFNENLGFMGGEDNEFFAAAYAMGYLICHTKRAKTYETVHPERLTYTGLIYRSYWCSASELRRLAVTRGWVSALGRKGHTIPFNLLAGAFYLLLGLALFPLSRSLFCKFTLKGGKIGAKAFGRLAALVGYLPEPYRQVVGY